MVDSVLCRAAPHVASGVLFVDGSDRVMLVEPSYKSHWDIPGGYVAPNETPLDAAVREVEEELGIQPRVGPLLVADWAPHPTQGDKMLFVFDGGVLLAGVEASITLDAEELVSWTYCDAELREQRMVPRLVRRVDAALTARRQGRTMYLQSGREVTGATASAGPGTATGS